MTGHPSQKVPRISRMPKGSGSEENTKSGPKKFPLAE